MYLLYDPAQRERLSLVLPITWTSAAQSASTWAGCRIHSTTRQSHYRHASTSTSSTDATWWSDLQAEMRTFPWLSLTMTPVLASPVWCQNPASVLSLIQSFDCGLHLYVESGPTSFSCIRLHVMPPSYTFPLPLSLSPPATVHPAMLSDLA
jgi:hypothetical protein